MVKDGWHQELLPSWTLSSTSRLLDRESATGVIHTSEYVNRAEIADKERVRSMDKVFIRFMIAHLENLRRQVEVSLKPNTQIYVAIHSNYCKGL